MEIIKNIKAAEIQNELATYVFFQNFPAESLAAFTKMVQVQQFEPNEFILKQGCSNEALYFLKQGQLEVLVDDQQVSLLSEPGEILGEMSVINKSQAMASVKVISPAIVFSIQESNFANLSNAERESFKVLMNQILTQVLVLRLDNTNSRAKKFEQTNKELMQAQMDLKNLNQVLENEIARRSKDLVQKVRDISESNLLTTAHEMNHCIQENSNLVSIENVKQWTSRINEVVDLLKPVIDLSEKNGPNHFRRVYLCDQNKKQQAIAKLALGGTGVSLDVFSNEDELIDQLNQSPADLVLIDAELTDCIAKVQAEWPKIPVVLLLNQDINSYLELLKKFPENPYFVSRNPDNRSLTIKSLTTTVAKILNKDFFGFEKYLSWGAHVVETKVKHSSERSQHIEKMESHFQSFGVRSTFLELAHTVAEEMLMNAIYDAPATADGKPLYNHLPRTEDVALTDEQAATFRYGTDGVLLAVSVTDPFGSLTKNVLQNYLEKNYKGEVTDSDHKGGAGKGLHMIIANADFVVFNVKPKKKTEVICFFQLERNKQEESQPTFHLFF